MEHKEYIFTNFSFWDRLTEEEKKMVKDNSITRTFEKNQVIGSTDTSCLGVVIVLDGSMRVSLISDEGREITIYRINEGECCVTTASCVIRQITFDTLISASEKTDLLVIPASVCAYLSEENIYFRSFMYEVEMERFSQTIWVMEQLLFRRFDQRLAEFLLNEYGKTGRADIKITQEELAREVNSAREVVARMLRHFTDDGLVEVKRGHILLKDIEGLRKII